MSTNCVSRHRTQARLSSPRLAQYHAAWIQQGAKKQVGGGGDLSSRLGSATICLLDCGQAGPTMEGQSPWEIQPIEEGI